MKTNLGENGREGLENDSAREISGKGSFDPTFEPLKTDRKLNRLFFSIVTEMISKHLSHKQRVLKSQPSHQILSQPHR